MDDLYYRQQEWSRDTFGPPSFRGPASAVEHLKRECDEVLAAPRDTSEYADLLILVFDAAWRAGLSYEDLYEAVAEKQQVNQLRKWPPISAQRHDTPTFHVPEDTP